MFLFVFWLRGRPSIKPLRNWGNEGGQPKCAQVGTVGKRYQASCVRMHLNTFTSLFMIFSYDVLFCL